MLEDDFHAPVQRVALFALTAGRRALFAKTDDPDLLRRYAHGDHGLTHGIRAALCHTEFEARATRQHNDANVLCLGQRVTGVGVALEILKVFTSTAFEGGRHQNRVAKISAIEAKR